MRRLLDDTGSVLGTPSALGTPSRSDRVFHNPKPRSIQRGGIKPGHAPVEPIDAIREVEPLRRGFETCRSDQIRARRRAEMSQALREPITVMRGSGQHDRRTREFSQPGP